MPSEMSTKPLTKGWTFDLSQLPQERAIEAMVRDREISGREVTEVSQEDFNAIKNILKKWNNDIFQERFCSATTLSLIKKCRALVFPKSDNLLTLTKRAALLLHSTTDKALVSDAAPTEAELNKIQETFQDLAQHYNNSKLQRSCEQLNNIAENPSLLVAHSALYLREMAKKIGKPDTYAFPYLPVLKTNSEKINGKMEDLNETMSRWRSLFFPEAFCTPAGQKELESTLNYPNCKELTFGDACAAIGKYFAHLVSKTLSAHGEVTEDTQNLMRQKLAALLSHAKKSTTDDTLYEPKREADLKCRQRERWLNKAKMERDQVLGTWAKDIEEKQATLRDLRDCVHQFSTLSEDLSEEMCSLEKKIMSKHKIKSEKTKEFQDKIALLSQQLDEAKDALQNASKETEKAKLPENLVQYVSEEHRTDLTRLIENVHILVDCYKAYLDYAQRKASLNIPKLVPAANELGS